MASESAVVIGVGPVDGLGAQLCMRFAESGMHVFVAGRTKDKLDAVVSSIGSNATAVVTDATRESDVIELFDAANANQDLTLAIYNAGNNTAGRILDMEADYFEQSWRVGAYGGFLFGREAARRMGGRDGQGGRGGSLLFTGASASLRGRAGFGAFNSSKGALRNLAQAMAKEFNAEGIHVGHVVVDGPIGGEKIKQGFPEYAEKLGDEGMISIAGIVDAFEFLHRQPKTAWSFELDVRTSLERW